MKTSRFKYGYRRSASKLHKKTGDLLREMFPSMRIYQEYPVNKINSSYNTGRHKFDWVILDLKAVIECHGAQHYQVCTFGGDQDKAIDQFRDIQYRDKKKKDVHHHRPRMP